MGLTPKKLWFDLETKSNINLKQRGAKVYAFAPSTDIICMGYHLEDHGSGLVYFEDAAKLKDKLKPILKNWGNLDFRAFNASFDVTVWNALAAKYNLPTIPLNQTLCVKAKAMFHNLPGNLHSASIASGLSARKQTVKGKELISNLCILGDAPLQMLFSLKHTQDKELRDLGAYCLQDVKVLRLLDLNLPELNESEMQIYRIDQKLNAQGLDIDIESIKTIVSLLEKYNVELIKSISELTNGHVTKATQINSIIKWLALKNVNVTNLKKETVTSLLTQPDLPPEVRQLLHIRQEASQSANSKYSKLLDLNYKGKLYDYMQIYGTITGRWASYGAQLHNMPSYEPKAPEDALKLITKGTPSILRLVYSERLNKVVSGLIRRMIVAPNIGEDNKLIITDYNAIEARILAWLTQDEVKLRHWSEGTDLYKLMASLIFKCQPDQVTKDQRNLGKLTVLGCGYGMGHKVFKLNVESKCKVKLTDHEAQLVIQTYRRDYPATVRFWSCVENVVRSAILNSGVEKQAGCSRWTYNADTQLLQCHLPSGRSMRYPKASIQQGHIVYQTVHGSGVYQVETFGGKLTENICQALARDVMVDGIIRLTQKTKDYRLLLTVHDELVLTRTHANVDLTSSVDFVNRCLTQAPFWAKSLPLKCEGFLSKRYVKA